jgi:ABC-type multidrug transport system permease subunit
MIQEALFLLAISLFFSLFLPSRFFCRFVHDRLLMLIAVSYLARALKKMAQDVLCESDIF